MAKKKNGTNNGSKSKRRKDLKYVKNDETSVQSKCALSYNGKVGIGFAISVLTVLSSVLWKIAIQNDLNWLNTSRHLMNQQNINLDSPLKRLLHITCQNNGNCREDELHAEGGALFSGKRLEKNRKILEIPRDMQIWTLDCFRDEFVKNKLVEARHSDTNAFLVEQAFLAAYLAMLVKRNAAIQHTSSSHQKTSSSIYLNILPTYEDYKLHHPVTFDLKELNLLYATHTQTYFLVSKRKEEIESEYKAFVHVSSEFGDIITYKDYVTARLNVQARGFEAGPLSDQDAQLKELEWYKKNFGVDIRGKVTAMVPILDGLNFHHNKRNVQYKYVPESRQFLAFASKNIKKGTELFGTYSDRADLFPVYGFVNGDLSERTSVLLGRHRIVDVRVVSENTHVMEQKNQIIVYLQQDDGYKECVTEENVVAMRFKRLKRKALLSIVNRYRNWVVSFPPRDIDQTHGIAVDSAVEQIISTGRLLALSHRDYAGNAYSVLKDAIEELTQHNDNDNPLVMKTGGGNGLEYRALIWVWRLARHGLNQNCDSYDEFLCSKEVYLELDSLELNSKQWLATYVRHQEIVALETVIAYAEHSYGEYARSISNFDPESEEFFYRSTLCPTDTPGLKQLVGE